jgi:hypothetical protein
LGKVNIPPLIRERAKIWELINSMPAEVRDDGVPRSGRAPGGGGYQIRIEEDLRMLLESLDGPRNQS